LVRPHHHDEWIERWRNGRTGWHQPAGNPNLQRHWRASGRRVLVPLCGKTPDLLWLEAAGNDVVGVELSEMAVLGFFEEQGLTFERNDGTLIAYRARERRITLYCGDYFEFHDGPFDAHYDRGALVALTSDLRSRYAAHTTSLLTDDAEQLVITVEYDQSICDGPPFSLGADDVQGYWPRLQRVAHIDDTKNAPPKFLDAGLDRMHEAVWRTP
jgi:thiopurine S-methyltransferase